MVIIQKKYVKSRKINCEIIQKVFIMKCILFSHIFKQSDTYLRTAVVGFFHTNECTLPSRPCQTRLDNDD